MKKWITVSLTLVALMALVVALSRWWLPLLGLAGAGNEALRSLDGIVPWLVWIFIGALVLLLINLRWDRLFQRAKARRLIDEAEEWSDDFRIGDALPLELANQEPLPDPSSHKAKVRLFAEQLEPVERQQEFPIAAAPESAPTAEIPAATPSEVTVAPEPPAPITPTVAAELPTSPPEPPALDLRAGKDRERVTVAFADQPEAEFVELPTTGELTSPLATLETETTLTTSNIANAAAIAQAEQLPASYFQLPPVPEGFTGRADELAALCAALDAEADRSLGIHGLAGTGKTALALALAQQLSARYPAAQFFLDLRGTSTRPLTSAEIQAHVLRVYYPNAQLPDNATARQNAYLAALSGKRVLLLFDNVAHLSQVKDVLPPAGCLLILTTREPFDLPGVFWQPLERLTDEAAAALLLKLVPRIGEHAVAIARSCSGWPSALSLAASALAQRPELTAASYAGKLAQVVQRFSTNAEAQPYEPALTLSYELLSPGLQKLWRTLAVFPDTFDVTGAAAVWALHPERALRALRRLMEFELVEGRLPNGRYRLHDLKQRFANQMLRAAERRVGWQNHAEYYQSVLHEADALYEQGGAALKRGLGLVDRDWHNIEAGQTWAAVNAETDQAACELCSSYPDAGRYVLDLRQSPRDRVRWCEAALAAAIRLHRRKAESRHLLALGQAHLQLGELDHARAYYERALPITQEQADYGGEARALNGLGATCFATHEPEAAQTHLTRALELARLHGDQRNEAAALGGLALVQHAQGDWPSARALFEQQLALTEASGDLARQGQAHFHFAQACEQAGEHAEALAQARTALLFLQQVESPLVEEVRAQLALWPT